MSDLPPERDRRRLRRMPDPSPESGRRRPRPAVVAGVIVALMLAVGVAFYLQLRSAVKELPPVPAPSVTRSSAAPDGSAAPVTPTLRALRRNVPVFWVAAAGTRAVLYRELRVLPDRGTVLDTAVAAIMEQTPSDPRYGTSWSVPHDLFTRQTPDGISVDVSADAFARRDVDPERAASAVQQLVWTATAAAALDVPVTILVDGDADYRAWGSVRLGGPIRRDAAARAPIWVLSPTAGALVDRGPGDTVAVTGDGQAFEGTFSWELADSLGKVLARGTAQGRGDAPGPFSFTVPVGPPGRYAITVFEADESGGPPQYPDTKTFTVD